MPGWRPLAALLAVAGATHLVRPDVYTSIVPRRLGDPRPWVLGSGVVELACAVGLAVPRTRRPAALATAALFVAVYPANVQMAVTHHQKRDRVPVGVRVAGLVRLPLQVPLVLWALRVARSRSAAA